METLVIQESSSEDEAINVDVWCHYYDSYLFYASYDMTHPFWYQARYQQITTVAKETRIQISSEVHRFKVHSWKTFNKLEQIVQF